MPTSRVKITVSRILAHTASAVWPDDYPDLSLAEAVAYEQESSVSELLTVEGKLSTTVTTVELTEG